jgi:hypothetical protein
MKYSQAKTQVYRCITCHSILSNRETLIQKLECFNCETKYSKEMALRRKKPLNISDKTRKKTEILNKKRKEKEIAKYYYKSSKKTELDKLRLDFALVEKSAPSKERTAKMILLNAKIMQQENINNKKKQ